MATTIYNNKYPIPEGFHDILHDFIKEIIRAQPNDIFDFGIQYFSKLETGQEPNKQKANSVVYPSGETSTDVIIASEPKAVATISDITSPS